MSEDIILSNMQIMLKFSSKKVEELTVKYANQKNLKHQIKYPNLNQPRKYSMISISSRKVSFHDPNTFINSEIKSMLVKFVLFIEVEGRFALVFAWILFLLWSLWLSMLILRFNLIELLSLRTECLGFSLVLRLVWSLLLIWLEELILIILLFWSWNIINIIIKVIQSIISITI